VASPPARWRLDPAPPHLAGALEKLDRTLLEAAADLGADRASSFWRVTVPLTGEMAKAVAASHGKLAYVVPKQEVLDRCEPIEDLGRTAELVDELWTEVKAS